MAVLLYADDRPAYEDIRNRAPVACHIATSLRLREVLELLHAALDRVSGEIRFMRGKGNKPRQAWLSHTAMKHVRANPRIRPATAGAERLWLKAARMEPPTRSERSGMDGLRPMPDIRVQMLGGFRVTAAGRTLPESAWQRKARQLFKCLLSRPRVRATRDLLIEWLWPESASEAATITLRSTVHALRSTLGLTGLEGGPDLVVVDRDGIGLATAADIWVDADEFERLIEAARSSAMPFPLLEEADALYLGEYRPKDLYEDWAAARREALKQAWVKLQFSLARAAEQSGDPERADTALRRLLNQTEP